MVIWVRYKLYRVRSICLVLREIFAYFLAYITSKRMKLFLITVVHAQSNYYYEHWCRAYGAGSLEFLDDRDCQKVFPRYEVNYVLSESTLYVLIQVESTRFSMSNSCSIGTEGVLPRSEYEVCPNRFEKTRKCSSFGFQKVLKEG